MAAEVFHNYITGAEITRPNRKVSAYVGSFGSDYLGDYDSVRKAVQAARFDPARRFVSLVFRDSTSVIVEIRKPERH